ncbi:hypothetical protein U1Q18_007278, partial [Sarracenia purpurea var. burkii]
ACSFSSTTHRDSGWSGCLSEAPLFQRQACEAAISGEKKKRRAPAEKTSGAGFSWLIGVDRHWVSVENKGCRRSQRIRVCFGEGEDDFLSARKEVRVRSCRPELQALNGIRRR